jgi:hypothetical protein
MSRKSHNYLFLLRLLRSHKPVTKRTFLRIYWCVLLPSPKSISRSTLGRAVKEIKAHTRSDNKANVLFGGFEPASVDLRLPFYDFVDSNVLLRMRRKLAFLLATQTRESAGSDVKQQHNSIEDSNEMFERTRNLNE